MFAVTAARIDFDAPLTALEVGDQPEPAPPDGWATISVRAAALNQHDLFSLRGVGLSAEQTPMILGCDASGVDDDGNEVVVHAVISSADWRDDETLDPRRSLLSEQYPGTFAERVAVPRRNLLPKPTSLSHAEAACMPTAWLTAYRMLFTCSGVRPGDTVLVQGAGGGVATALVSLGAAAGLRMWVTSRDEAKGERAVRLGAERSFGSGERLPERVDAVMETVGEATWKHSVRSLRAGGVLVVSGATSGYVAPTELAQLFFRQLRVQGSTMGTRHEMERLLAFCEHAGIRPTIDRVLPAADAQSAFEALESGEVFGKVVLDFADGSGITPPAGR